MKEKMAAFVFKFFKPALIGFITSYGDELQDKIKKAIVEKGPEAVDEVFDSMQKNMIDRINAL